MGRRASGRRTFEGGKCQGLSNPTPTFQPTQIHHLSLGIIGQYDPSLDHLADPDSRSTPFAPLFRLHLGKFI